MSKAKARKPNKSKKSSRIRAALGAAVATNHPPTLIPPTLVRAHPGQTIIGGFAGNDPDGDSLKHVKLSGPSSAVIDQYTGLTTYGPIPWSDLGTQSIVCKVRDSGAPHKFAVATWQVIVEDQPPTFATTSVPDAFRGVPYQCYFHASDHETDDLRWSLVNHPLGAWINAKTGLFSWPNPRPLGTVSVTVKVREKQNSHANCVQSFVITVLDPSTLDEAIAQRLPAYAAEGNGQPRSRRALNGTAVRKARPR